MENAPENGEEIVARTRDGWSLRGERRARPGSCAVVVCAHAMMVDRRTLDRPRGAGLMSALGEAGLEVLAFDCRGHGQSGPRADLGGRWSYDDIVRYDVPAMVARGRALAGKRPVVLLGHSLFAHAGLIAAGLDNEPPDALVALAPNLWTPSLEPSAPVRAVKGALLRGWRALGAIGYVDPRWTRAGTDPEPRAYIEQFAAMWRDDRTGYEPELGRARIDVLAYSSVNDRLFARPPCVARFLALAPNARIEHRVIDGPDAPDHMGFVTDPRRASTWAEIAEWIQAR